MRNGFMKKQGHVWQTWKLRYFVLKRSELTYYGSHQGGRGVDLKGRYMITDKHEVLTDGSNPLRLLLGVPALKTDTKLLLEVTSPVEFQSWIDAINEHIAFAKVSEYQLCVQLSVICLCTTGSYLCIFLSASEVGGATRHIH